MSYDSFYRYIVKKNDKYWIVKDNEWFMDCETLAEALYERDRLEATGWEWDNYVQLPDTINGYIHIDLPPFTKQSSHINRDRECWVVRGHGKSQKYYGTYYTREEAEKVARIYDANISHKRSYYRIQKRINGRTKYFGRFSTYEEAEERVKLLEKNDWEMEE